MLPALLGDRELRRLVLPYVPAALFFHHAYADHAAVAAEIDPAVPGKVCHWATLTYCCWMHAVGALGGADAVPAPHWVSGSPPPPPPPPTMPAELPPVVPPGWPASSYTLSVSTASGAVLRAATEQGILTGTTTLLQAAVPSTSTSDAGAVTLP